MQAYVIRRILLMIPTILLVTMIAFLAVRFIPGSVIELMVAEMGEESGRESELTIEYLKEALGLDMPLHVQYWRWLSAAARGDLGQSLWTDRPVTQEIFSRLPVSLELGALALIVGLLIAVPIGTYSAIRQDTAGDYIGRTIAILFISLPTFWTGTMVIVYPSIWWNWSPAIRYIPFFDNPAGNLLQFIIPAIIMGMVLSGTTMRMTRTMMLEVLRQDYIRTAWSKGLKERVVIIRHAIRNALIPIVTLIGGQLPMMVGGAVIIESIFNLPGLGRLMVNALTDRDYPVVSGVNLFLSMIVMLNILFIDMLYPYLDTRVRYK